MPIDYEMDPAEVKRSLDEAVAEIAPHVGTEYTAAQVFHREGAWANQGGFGRFVGKVLGKDKGGPKEPEQNNLLILTPERLYLIGCKPKGGRWSATEPIGDWALEDLRISTRDERVNRNAGDLRKPISSVETIKVAIEIVPKGRTLELEGTVWGNDKTTETTVKALLEATGGASIESEWGEEQAT